MSKKYHVMAVGNALVDHEYALNDEQLIQTELTKGNMTLVSHEEQIQLLSQFDHLNLQPSKLAGGGSAANSMYALSNLGGSAFYACRVSDDGAGQFYIQDLQAAGVATSSHAVQHDEVTGSCVVCTTPDGERTMQTYLGTSSEISEENIDFEAINDSDWLYIEGYLAMSPSMNTAINKLRKKAKHNQTKIAVSFADPAVVKFAKEGLKHILGVTTKTTESSEQEGVDLIFCNAEEAQLFTEQSNLSQSVRSLLQVCNTAVVTVGAKGVIIGQNTFNASGIINGITLLNVPTPAIESDFLDTLGAGDNFAGAFMYALTQGHSLSDCAVFANHVAGQVVQQFGPRLSPEQYKMFSLP